MAVSCRLTLYLSPRNRLSSPMATSKRWRGAMRLGLRSALLVPGGAIETRVDPYCVPGHRPLGEIGTPRGFEALGAAARTEPQNNPAWNCWSGLRGETSTAVAVPFGPLLQSPPAQGTGPATSPESYRQLKP